MTNLKNNLVLGGIILVIIFYIYGAPNLINYLDASTMPIYQRFIIYEFFIFLSITIFVYILAKSYPKLSGKEIRYSLGIWAFYHFIDWIESPWALSSSNIITKTTAWSTSSDALGASLFCKCEERATELVCNAGCFDTVYTLMPLIFLFISIILFGDEIKKFIKKFIY